MYGNGFVIDGLRQTWSQNYQVRAEGAAGLPSIWAAYQLCTQFWEEDMALQIPVWFRSQDSFMFAKFLTEYIIY